MELTAKQVMERLGVSRDWVSRMCRRGALSGARKVGPIWLIPEAALEGLTPRRPGRPRLIRDTIWQEPPSS